MVKVASRRVHFLLATVLAVAFLGLAVVPSASAVTMTPDYGVVLDDGSGSWDVVANDGDPNTSGFDYVEVISGPDTACAWICASGTSISVDAVNAPGSVTGTTVDIGYQILDGDTGTPLGSSTLTVAVVPAAGVTVSSGNGQVDVSWPGMPPAIDGLSITYDTAPVSDHTSGGTTVTSTGTATRTVTGLTNGATYYFYVTPFLHGVDLEVGCGYACGSQASASPRAVNHPPVAVDDTVSLVDTSPKFIDVTSNDTDADFDLLTITSHTTPAHGGLTCDTASCEYTPSGAPQDDSFTYTVSDGYGGTDTGAVTLLARNAHAVDDSGSTFVDESVLIDVLANDTGTISGDFVTVGSTPAGVTASVDPDTGKVEVAGVTAGSHAFPYSIHDSDGDVLSTATVTVTVGPKRPLVAADDSWSTDLDVATDINVAGNDYIQVAGFPLDTPNTNITVQPAHGTATLSFAPEDYYDRDTGLTTLRNLPRVHYVPATDYHGPDSLTYQLQDAAGHTDTATVSLDVGVPQVDFVDATPGIASADLDFFFSGSPAVDDVMACYTVGTDRTTPPPAPTTRAGCDHEVPLPAGTPSSYHWTGLTNDVYYTVSVWVHSHDGTADGVWSDAADTTFRPGVDPVRNLTGDGGADNFQVSWANPLAPQASTGTIVRYSTGTTPATPTDGSGGVTVGSGVTSATVPGLAPGTYHVAVFSTNTDTYGDRRAVTLEVAAGNHPPTVTPDSVSLDENTFRSFNPLANDTDPDGDPIDIRTYTQPAHGSVDCSGDSSINDTWSCLYSPAHNFFGSDSFTYVAWDHRFGETTGTVTIQVNQVNTAPHARDDSFTASTALATAVDLTLDASDPEGDALDYLVVTPPAHGTLTCPTPNTGHCSYTSAAAYVGPDSFVWKVTDHGTNPPTLSSNNATMSIDVVANQPPTVRDQSITANSGAATTFSIATGSSDPDGDTLTFSKTSEPQKGSVTCTGAGSCTYTPLASASGQDSFNFQASDGHGHLATGSVLIDITHVNRAPVAGDTSDTTDNATPLVTNVNSLTTDPDGDALTFSKVSGPTGTDAGTVSCAGTSCTYTPSPTFTGTTSYTYQASDGHLSDTGVVTITVTQANRAPHATDDAATTRVDTQVSIDVLANDTDADGDPLTFVKVSDPAHGAITCSSGVCTYTPSHGFAGDDSFTYRADDGTVGSNVATVRITVAANRAPVATADSLTTTANTVGTVDVSANDTDADGDPLTFAKGTDGAHGTVTCTSAGSCSYTPASGYTGSDSFTYTVSDGAGGTATGTVSVTVSLGVFVFSVQPKVTGTPKVGKTLTAKKGTFTPTAATVTYAWLRNGKAIKGATKATYRLTTQDRGKLVSVKITYQAPATQTVRKTVKVTRKIT